MPKQLSMAELVLLLTAVGNMVALLAILWRGGIWVGRITLKLDMICRRLDKHGTQIEKVNDNVVSVDRRVVRLEGP